MNIKEHIEAGHYPTDDKGRAQLTTRGGNTVTICATDGPGDFCLVGFSRYSESSWKADGTARPPYVDQESLLPPPSRKVKVTRWVVITKNDGEWGPFINKIEADQYKSFGTLVKLSGEYEEP